MFRRRKHHSKNKRGSMAVVLSEAILERSSYIRRLVDELQTDSNELKQLIEAERKAANDRRDS